MINKVSFAEFLDAFGDGYNRMIDPETEQVFTKPSFCRELLCRISANRNLVKYKYNIEHNNFLRDDATYFPALYRKSQPRSLKPIAKYLESERDRDEEQFKEFLQEYVKKYSKEILLKNFKKCLPDTTLQTLFDDITKLFVVIITNAANEPDKRKKVTDSVQYDDSDKEDTPFKDIPATKLHKIDDCILGLINQINTLLQTGELFLQKVNASLPSTLYNKIPGWDKLQMEYEKYQTLTTKLHSYFERYKCKQFEPASPFRDKFQARSFWECHPAYKHHPVTTLGEINEYKEILIGISKEIEKHIDK